MPAAQLKKYPWGFQSALIITPANKVGEWRLITTLTYRSKDFGWFHVPCGFTTDLASIPRPLRIIFSVNGRHRGAAVLHDYLYGKKPVKRRQADRIFYEAMLDRNVPASKARVFYWGVRCFGWLRWGKD